VPDQPGLLREGFRRTWRYQRVIWFIFVINLVLGHFGASPAIHKLDGVTDHSLYSQRLSNMFDLGTFSALASNPEVKLFEGARVSISLSLVFFVVMMFLTGGILEAYRADRRLTTREFFEACGAYLWRWVRLLILMGIILIPVLMIVSSALGKLSFGDLNAAQEKPAFWMLLGTIAITAFLLMSIRLWFDMAQVRAVVEEETGMLHNADRAFRLTLANFGSLFWMYARISILGWLIFAAGLCVWAKMPPARFLWTFLVLELVVLCGFGTRLWQRSCEMVWYQRRFLAPLAAPITAPVAPTPSSLVTIAPPPQSSPM